MHHVFQPAPEPKMAQQRFWHILALSLLLLGCTQEGENTRNSRADARQLPEESDAEKSLAQAQQADASDGIEEPVTVANYYVRNDWDEEVQLAATDLAGQPVQLVTDRVAARSEALIFHVLEGSGGHAMPSNFFQSFTASRGGTAFHEGVRDYEWPRAEGAAEVERYRLVLSPPVSYACEEAADCTVKDVGNCCGYYPRCVNVDSPTSEPVCAPDVASVCGWPDITHCTCVENRCRSMQDDREV